MAARKPLATPKSPEHGMVAAVVDTERLDELMEDLKAGEANYLLINIISRRIRSLNEGEKPQVEIEAGADPINVAMEELRQGKLVLAPEEPKAEEEEAAKGESEEE
ncbi:MAG: DNA-directed RNA polymerase subunit omega [Candidatus Sumerlaeota bacterium]|nr:DNA-directed RNA polymerase subunit omega [Candidatus Sumerlaeota bacterium]